MLEHVAECNLSITNTSFKKRIGKLWTFISDMNGSKSMIDYILVNKKWKNSIHNSEAFNFYSSCGSDHRVVVAKLRLSLRKRKSPPRKVNYDWEKLNDVTLQERYTVTIRNKYDALRVEEETINQQYDRFIQANKETAEELIPKIERNKKSTISNDPKVIEARNDVQSAFKNYIAKNDHESHVLLQKRKNELQQIYLKLQETELNNLVSKVEHANRQSKMKESWRLINRITNRKSTKQGMIKGASKEERVNKWYEHFSNLLGKEIEPDASEMFQVTPIFKDLDIDDGDFTLDEVCRAKRMLRNGKHPGPDNIPPEVLKKCDLDDIILDFANKLMNENLKPDQWSEIDILPLPKSGDLSNTSNYRGISLTSMVAKLINKMILNRIQSKLDTHLRPNQNGFRPGRSTTSQILALRRIIEEVNSRNRKTIIVYVDFKKAFDSIDRRKMLEILKAYDVPINLRNAIAKFYENTKAKVISPDGETEFFFVRKGVLQGDTLAPYLFVIVIDYLLRMSFKDKKDYLGLEIQQKKSRRHKAIRITDLDYADDLALISEQTEQAQESLHCLETEAEIVGLYCNSKKTEVQHFNQDIPVHITAKNGEILKNVDNFKYLGSWTKSSEDDFNVRKALAWNTCHKMNKIWKSSLPRNIKVRVFLTTVESVLLYGAETWTLTKALQKKIDGCYTRMLRMALNVSWQSHTSNAMLYGNLPKVSSKIRKRRMQLAGHLIRHEEEIANKLVLWQPTDGRPSRGRKKKTFIQNLLEDTGAEDVNELKNLAKDRNGWKDRVEQSLGRPGGRPR